MKKCLLFVFVSSFIRMVTAQEVLRLQSGATVVVQNGVDVFVQGGVTLQNGSLLVNNGTLRIQNNLLGNQSDWRDNSVIGALGGTGLVAFNSNLNHQYWGPTHFYNVQINTGGLTINNPFTVDNQLELVKGKISTSSFYVFLSNSNTGSLVSDANNTGYSQSWINGNFRRLISTNSDAYDFPVGGSARCNLLRFLNNNVTGVNYLTGSFGPKPGTDAGLNVTENGSMYTSVNSTGVWYLDPDAPPSGGNYALHLYFNGFTGLTDNQFGILRRPDLSANAADWRIPASSSREPFNGLGRKVSDGFARRFNISDFSQFGIGTLSAIPCDNCAIACTYSQGFYSNVKGKACYDGITVTGTQLMLNAFGNLTSQVFGNVANRRFFTLYKTDITNGNIFKMLPGSGNSQPLAVDNTLPYDGASYSDQSTWYLVPIPISGSQKGKINNQLLSQAIALWFNLRTSSSLATVDLANDTLLTTAQTSCGSGIATGPSTKFGLPHSVITYLDSANGYTHDVSGLFRLANDVLGGVNSSVNSLDVQLAVAAINTAFDGCRILTTTIPYGPTNVLTKNPKIMNGISENMAQTLRVTPYPNPYEKQFSLRVISPVSGFGKIEFFAANGTKISEQRQFIASTILNVVPYKGPRYSGVLVYKITIGDYHASGSVIGIN